jgi:hypothetical protein
VAIAKAASPLSLVILVFRESMMRYAGDLFIEEIVELYVYWFIYHPCGFIF